MPEHPDRRETEPKPQPTNRPEPPVTEQDDHTPIQFGEDPGTVERDDPAEE
jgi:hypothetical protein